MKKLIATFALLTVLCSSIGSLYAQEKKSTLGKPIFPKLEYVNLNSELGLISEALRGFGARVDDARRDADAEAIAAQAVLLAFAEEIAASKAKTVTSIQILEEAVRIADEQQNRNAAKTVVAAARRIPGGAAIAEKMNSSLALFALTRGEGNFIGYVKIQNRCDRVLDVYVDGNYVGFLYAGEGNTFSTGNGTTTARVTDAFGNTVNEILYIKQDETFTWTINP